MHGASTATEAEPYGPLPIEPAESPAPHAGMAPGRRRLGAVLSLSFGTALVVADGALPGVALPTIAPALGTDDAAIVLVVTVYQLVLVMAVLPLANLGENIGLRRVYRYGLAGFILTTLPCFLVTSLAQLLVLRALQALCAAAMLGVSLGLLRAIYPDRQLGRGIGVNGVVTSSAAALAPTIGGLILAVAPWRWVFASILPFALLALLLARDLPDDVRHHERFDIAGALQCAATLGLLCAGIEGLVHGGNGALFAGIVAAGIAVGVVFVRREIADPRAMLPLDLLRRPVLALSVLGTFVGFMGAHSLVIALPFQLQHRFHLSAAQVGSVIAAWPLTTLFVAPLAGALSDRLSPALMGGFGMLAFACGLIAMALLPAGASYPDMAWRMMLTGAGFAIYMSPNARLIIGSAPPERGAAAGGLIATTRLAGQTFGATLASALLAAGVGTNGTPAFVSAALALVAAVCSVARLRGRGA